MIRTPNQVKHNFTSLFVFFFLLNPFCSSKCCCTPRPLEKKKSSIVIVRFSFRKKCFFPCFGYLFYLFLLPEDWDHKWSLNAASPHHGDKISNTEHHPVVSDDFWCFSARSASVLSFTYSFVLQCSILQEGAAVFVKWRRTHETSFLLHNAGFQSTKTQSRDIIVWSRKKIHITMEIITWVLNLWLCYTKGQNRRTLSPPSSSQPEELTYIPVRAGQSKPIWSWGSVCSMSSANTRLLRGWGGGGGNCNDFHLTRLVVCVFKSVSEGPRGVTLLRSPPVSLRLRPIHHPLYNYGVQLPLRLSC